MEWSDDMVLEFLQNYETEPIIWDPKNLNHKRKHLVADAWRRLKNNLSYNISMTIEELKKKRDSLMAYYRLHLNKIKNSKKSGMGMEESYKTNWFAFSAMNSFLAPIYECSATINTEEPIENTGVGTQINESVDNASITKIIKKKRQQGMPELLHAKKQMDEAFSIIKERQQNVHECDLYAQLLAEKLKKIDEERRIILMHNIDNLVFQEIMSAKAQERAASVASSYSSMSQSNYNISSPNSPIIIRPSSPNPQTVQSTPSFQPVLSQQIQSSPSNLISVESQQSLSMSQNDRRKIRYYNIDSEQE